MNTALKLVSNNIDTPVPDMMSSLEIAKLTGKNHADVMKDIRAMVTRKVIQLSEFSSSSYQVVGQTRKYGYYHISKEVAENRFLSVTNKYRTHCEREHGALCTIEQLNNVMLIRQYQVGKYRIDGYCKETNTAYEIDEEQHFTVSGRCKDAERQKYIEDVLGCNFVRINVSYKKVK